MKYNDTPPTIGDLLCENYDTVKLYASVEFGHRNQELWESYKANLSEEINGSDSLVKSDFFNMIEIV